MFNNKKEGIYFMSPRERLLPGRSSEAEKEARRIQQSVPYREWLAQEEKPSICSTKNQELPKANPQAYYQTSEGKLLQGLELPSMVLPVNLEEVHPSFFQKLHKKVSLWLAQGNKKIRRKF